jgi:hypothetical protein
VDQIEAQARGVIGGEMSFFKLKNWTPGPIIHQLVVVKSPHPFRFESIEQVPVDLGDDSPSISKSGETSY